MVCRRKKCSSYSLQQGYLAGNDGNDGCIPDICQKCRNMWEDRDDSKVKKIPSVGTMKKRAERKYPFCPTHIDTPMSFCPSCGWREICPLCEPDHGAIHKNAK